MSRFLTLALLLGCVSRVAAAPAPPTEADRAVAKALVFLKRSQTTDGSWSRPRGPDPAMSALTLRAFLAAGHVPGEKASEERPYGAVMEKGIHAVLKMQKPSGLIATESGLEMYHHGISTLMLAEAIGKVRDKKLADEMREALKKAVAVILKAQRKKGPHRGGWRYRVQYSDADLSVTGWQVRALYAAKAAGCEVPAEALERAMDYVKRCQDPRSGGFRYTVHGGVTVPCSSTGIVLLELAGKGKEHSPEALKAGAYVLKQPPRWRAHHFFYNVYHGADALSRLGGNYWKDYRPRLHKVLLDNQKANGSWDLDYYGPAYSTAMAVLALTAERSHPPAPPKKQPPDKP